MCKKAVTPYTCSVNPWNRIFLCYIIHNETRFEIISCINHYINVCNEFLLIPQLLQTLERALLLLLSLLISSRRFFAATAFGRLFSHHSLHTIAAFVNYSNRHNPGQQSLLCQHRALTNISAFALPSAPAPIMSTCFSLIFCWPSSPIGENNSWRRISIIQLRSFLLRTTRCCTTFTWQYDLPSKPKRPASILNFIACAI